MRRQNGAGNGTHVGRGGLQRGAGRPAFVEARCGGKQVGSTARAYGFDVSNPGAAEAAFRRIEAELGPVDAPINNARILSNNKAAETAPDEWRRVLAVNLDCVRFLLHPMSGFITGEILDLNGGRHFD